MSEQDRLTQEHDLLLSKIAELGGRCATADVRIAELEREEADYKLVAAAAEQAEMRYHADCVTLERERDAVLQEMEKAGWPCRLVELPAKFRELEREVADYKHSFDLYDAASRSLLHAYKVAHPDVPDNVWPDTTTVNVWAAGEVMRLTSATAGLKAIVETTEAARDEARAENARQREWTSETIKGYQDRLGETLTSATEQREKALDLEREVARLGDALLEFSVDHATVAEYAAVLERAETAEAEVARLRGEERPDTHEYGCPLDGEPKTTPCADCERALREIHPKRG